MRKARVVGLLASPIGALAFFRYTYLAAYADHYGVKGAHNEWRFFLSLTIICVAVFVACASGLITSLVKSRHAR